MSAHTPGPWGLATLSTSIGSCHQIGPFPSLGVRSETHACIYADNIRVGIDDCLPIAQELSANARLMAAAPELLVIAQECAEACAECNGTGVPEFGDDAGKSCPDCADVRAVIAKATGVA